MKMNRVARFSCITNLFELFADLSGAGAKVRHVLCKDLFYGDIDDEKNIQNRQRRFIICVYVHLMQY